MAYDVVNAADLPQETSTTLDGTEQLIGFDTAQGKRVTVNDLAEYILQRKLSSLAGASQTVAAALAALNSKPIFVMGDFDNDNWTLNLSQPYITFRWTNGYTGTVPTDGWGLCVQFHVVQLFFTSNHAWYRINVNGWGSWMLLGQ